MVGDRAALRHAVATVIAVALTCAGVSSCTGASAAETSAGPSSTSVVADPAGPDAIANPAPVTLAPAPDGRIQLNVNPVGLAGLVVGLGPATALDLLPPAVAPTLAGTVASYEFLGKPTSHAAELTHGGIYQSFEGGAVYSWAGEAFALPTPMAAYYAETGGPDGDLGRPTGPLQNFGSAAALPLERGSVYTSPAGTYVVVAPLWSPDTFGAEPWGPLGAPTAAATTSDAGVTQHFANGLLFAPADDSSGLIDVTGDTAVAYLLQGGAAGPLGEPASIQTTDPATGAPVQQFAHGAIYQTPRGVIAVSGPTFDSYVALGGPTGFGLPTGSVEVVAGGSAQSFTGGGLYASGAGVFAVTEPLLAHYLSAGGPGGAFGLPTAAAYDAGGGVTAQVFAGGIVQDPAPWRPPEGILGAVEAMPVVSGGVPISDGWNGTRVHALQERLGIHRVETAQTYDAETQAAVRTWQANHGLPVTGVVDEATWNSIDPGMPFTIDAWRADVTVPMTATADQRIDALVDFAVSQVGAQYAWGGAGPFDMGYDCSGIVLAAMNAAGLDPGITPLMHAEPSYRSTYTLFHHPDLAHVPVSQMQRGDLVFFQNTAGVIMHAAVYIGDGMMVESTVRSVKYKAYSPNLYGYQVLSTVIRPFPEG